MRTMHMAARRSLGHGGAILPTVFPALAARGVHIRRGELTLVAGEPGSGKSSWALNLAMRAAVPVLYISADSDMRTQMVRMLAAESGHPQEEVEKVLPTHTAWASRTLEPYRRIRWCFDSSPTLADIEEEVDAFITMYGDPPALLILDNATDIVADEGDEWTSLRALMKDMKFWARFYDLAAVALHHTSEAEKGNPCPPRSAIQGKVSQVPALVLTLASSTEGWMWACPVKNRHGKADKTGVNASSWQFFPDTMTFEANPADELAVGS